MTTAQALLIFDVLQDQYGAPYFTDTQKLIFLNSAQLEVLNRLCPDTLGGNINVEFDQNVYENIRPLVYDVDSSIGTVSGSSFVVTRGEVLTLLRVASSDFNCDIFRILNVSRVSTTNPADLTPIKYTKLNNISTYLTNVFKTPIVSDLRYTETSSDFRIFPAPTGSFYIKFFLIKTPRILDTGNSPEFGDYVMNQVILQALKLAGIAVSDTQEIQNIVGSGIQSGQ